MQQYSLFISGNCSTCFGWYLHPSPGDHNTVSTVSGISGVPRNFVRGGSTNSVEDRGQREQESEGDSPIVRGSGGSCNLIQEISFHIVKVS